GCVSRHRQRVPDRRLLDQVRRPLLRQRAAAVLQAHVVLGRARRLDHVLGLPAGPVRLDRGLCESRTASRAYPLRCGRHLHGADVLSVPDGGAQEPVHDVSDEAAGRGEWPEPAAAELLDGHPSAVALHRVRGHDHSVRVRNGGVDYRTSRRFVAARGAALRRLFAAFMVAILAFGFGFVIYRMPLLRARNTLDSWASREAAFLVNNWILLFSAFFILFATMFPTLSEAVTGERITVGPPFFNRWMLPIGLVLLFLTGVGPLLAWRKSTLRNLRDQ